jgi:hypothetical protein
MIYLALGRKYEKNVYAGPWKGYAAAPLEKNGTVVAGKAPFYRIHLKSSGNGTEVAEERLAHGTLEYYKVLKRVSSSRGADSPNKSHRNLLSNAQNGYKPRCLVTREQLIKMLEENNTDM